MKSPLTGGPEVISKLGTEGLTRVSQGGEGRPSGKGNSMGQSPEMSVCVWEWGGGVAGGGGRGDIATNSG